MKELTGGLVLNWRTHIMYEEVEGGGSPYSFEVHKNENGEVVGWIHFQEGPIKENGVNGISNEDLLTIVTHRLKCFQKTKHRCRENDNAIDKVEEALLWLHKRTAEKETKRSMKDRDNQEG
jgi:hypothetical protein